MSEARRSPSVHCIFRWVAAALAVSCCLGTARIASASCGDYLIMPGHGDGAGSASHHSHRPQPVPTPCRGPQCRRQGPLETPPAPPPNPVESRQLAASLLEVAAAAITDHDWLPVARSRHSALGLPHRLDRPPKAA